MQTLEITRHLPSMDDLTLDIHENLPSTNDYFKGKPIQKPFEFCFAENQTKGRGRLGRSWHSPSGVNLMFSCRWQLPPILSLLPVGAKNFSPAVSGVPGKTGKKFFAPTRISLGGLSCCVGLSLIDALSYLPLPNLMCKWPNDLYYQDKKLAGILIELHGNNNQIHEAIIGIGLNVNMEASAIDIEKPWTSLKQILGTTQDRGFLAANIIQSLVIYLQRFATQGWKDFMSEWDKFDYLKGRQVSIPVEQTHVNGVATGIDSDGSLLVKTEDGKITPCLSGEVRV